ncbi:DUF1515 family protein [Rhizobium phaseoli]|uniref:DUF1515 family protein n=1 Tax=Rhizobium phaseoli TaxID=396 RepID=UPI00244E9578|nr:DUF1515 family protein [Rhizobium phaseoli]
MLPAGTQGQQWAHTSATGDLCLRPETDAVKMWRQRGIGALAIVGIGASAITFIVTKFGAAVIAWATSR